MATRRNASSMHRNRIRAIAAFAALATAAAGAAAIFSMTLTDFHVPGSQVGDLQPETYFDATACAMCHSSEEYPELAPVLPYDNWKGSLMAQAGRDPLFFAQMALAEQDVTSVGYYCLRCHVPNAIISGHANVTDGSALDEFDAQGVSCHFCHSMVDPIYKPGISPVEDEAILAGLADVPSHFGNAMFVLDPDGIRRGPRPDADAMHEFLHSPFHRSGEMCGTCHDVGNVATTRQPDGTYSYNAIGESHPTGDPWHQFPLERTYTEWKLSAFADGGVDMGGRFGGEGVTVVSTCQDCHMPRAAGVACVFGPERPDVARHDFAGAAVGVLEMVKRRFEGDPAVDPAAIDAAKAKSLDMLARSASLEVEQIGASLRVRVINESGHKLPTGHIEGRRVWVNVRLLDGEGIVLQEYGAYDDAEAHLDGSSTEVYEMLVGLSPAAAKLTGLPAGETSHMALADTIVKDNRIPPRGFVNAAFDAGGAPVVDHDYADGQYWDDSWFAIASGTAAVEVSVYYQNLPRHYIEHLRDANVTNDWGEVLHSLWQKSGRGEPNLVARTTLDVAAAIQGDFNLDGMVDGDDLGTLLGAWGAKDHPADLELPRGVHGEDLGTLLGNWGWHGAP